MSKANIRMILPNTICHFCKKTATNQLITHNGTEIIDSCYVCGKCEQLVENSKISYDEYRKLFDRKQKLAKLLK